MPDLIETSLAGPRALRAAIGFLDRLPANEDAVAGSVENLMDQIPGLSSLRR
jgi:hypothetical protein